MLIFVGNCEAFVFVKFCDSVQFVFIKAYIVQSKADTAVTFVPKSPIKQISFYAQIDFYSTGLCDPNCVTIAPKKQQAISVT